MSRLTQMLRLASLLFALSLLHGCAASGGELMLLSNADGDHDIYIYSTSGVRQITRNDNDDLQASWSPDGKSILYTSNLAGNPEIYTAHLASGQLTRLTDNPGLDGWPQWSPDASRIVFVSTRNQRESLFVMDADGQNVSELTPETQSANYPVWSPDGKTIAYLQRHDGTEAIALIGADGKNNRTFLESPGLSGLTWSPDGSTLLYSSRRKSNLDLYRTNVADGSEVRLTTDLWIDAEPAWSPDGSKIIWLSARDDGTRRNVYVMNSDGTGKRALTTGPAEHMNPQWSPDSKQIAYVAYHDRRFVLHLLDLSSGERVRLSASRLGGTQFKPVFNPRGSHLSFTATGMETQSRVYQAGLRERLAKSQEGEGE